MPCNAALFGMGALTMVGLELPDAADSVRRPTRRQGGSPEASRASLRDNPTLAAVVRGAVVPRLAGMHTRMASHAFGHPVNNAWTEQAAALARSLPRLDMVDAAQALRALNPGGSRFEAVCHDVLIPAAARLRTQRDSETPDQAGYLMGVWRLRMLLIGLDDDGHASATAPRGGASALLVAGGSLTLSLEHAVVMRLFKRAGWSVRCCGRRAEEEPSIAVRRECFDLAWFSIDEETDLRRVKRRVMATRRASGNHCLRVLSGWLLASPPPSPELLGADAVTDDAGLAVSVAGRVLALH